MYVSTDGHFLFSSPGYEDGQSGGTTRGDTVPSLTEEWGGVPGDDRKVSAPGSEAFTPESAGPSTIPSGYTSQDTAVLATWSAQWDLPTVILLSLVIALGFGNVLTLVLYSRSKEMRASHFNLLMAAMAAAHVVLSIGVSTLELIQVLVGHAEFGHVWCIVKLGLRSGCFNMSIFLVVAIAALRFYAACRRVIQPYSRRAMLVVIGVSGFFGLVGVAMRFDTSTYRHYICLGVYKEIDASAWVDAYGTCACFLALISYLLLFLILKCRKQPTITDPSRCEILTKRVGLSLTLMFCLCFILPGVPHACGFRVPRHLAVNYDVLLKSITLAHSSLNPLIYLCFTPCLRRALGRMMNRDARVGAVSPTGKTATTIRTETTTVSPSTPPSILPPGSLYPGVHLSPRPATLQVPGTSNPPGVPQTRPSAVTLQVKEAEPTNRIGLFTRKV